MAIIHHGANKTEIELQQFADAHVRERKKAWRPIEQAQKKRQKRERRSYRKGVKAAVFSLAICLLILAALLLFPQIIEFLHTGLTDLSTWLTELAQKYIGGLIIDKYGDPLIYDNPLEVVHDIAVKLLLILITFVLEWIGKLAKPIVMIVAYGGSLLSVSDSITSLIAARRNKPTIPDPVFDEAAARAEAMRSLPTELEIQRAGLEGEQHALFMLDSLPDSCHLFTNLIVSYEGKSSETDIVVVTPRAITIIEVKNYKDEIRGDWGDEYLYNNVHRGENVHTKEFFNPIRQVATHARRLKGFLHEHGIDVWVNTGVAFPHLDANLRWVSDKTGVLDKCPVFAYSSSTILREYVQGTAGRQQDIPVDDVVKLFDGLLKNPPPRPEY